MRVAIFNNYKTNLFQKPDPPGIRNMIAYSDNIGNIVFLESITRELCAESINIYDFIINYKSYEDKYDMIVLSLANMISPSYQLSNDFLDALEKTKISICIFSIGIQVYSKEELINLELNENVKRILNLSIKSGTTIGLRGEITKEYLDSKGIKNTQVIGCPSIFYKKNIPTKKDKTPKDILISGSFNGNWKKPLSDLFYFGYKYGKSYLIQSESRILVDKYKISHSEILNWDINEERLNYLSNKGYDYSYYCNKQMTPEELGKWFVNNSVFYSDFDDWLNSMNNYDLHIGVRFHGSVMSTLAGVNTIILPGDLRVKEFVDFHGLPNLNIFDFTEDLTPKEIYEKIDYSTFESKYDELKINYIKYLRKNGLQFTSR